ncbi:Thioredoxin family protein [Citrus sinensis]|uniref:Thioredoxin family protein n=1 Tax=Citrus sinensis TaxID=2711 RepID=A0ACB8JZK2_CITSI|nr:Thioredoxin family protein [Citrus sinensis]
MAGVLNFSQPSLFRPLSGSRQIPRTSFSIRATSESSKTPQTPSSSSTTSTQEKPEPTPFAAPPNFKPPEPKRFAVRPDKALDILGAALALFFRFGTGVFVSGYSASFVSKDEIPPDQYAMEIAGSGFKVKETSKLGPRPEKPIEIYEYERLTARVVFSTYGLPWTTCKLQLSLLSKDIIGTEIALLKDYAMHVQFDTYGSYLVREIVAVLDLDVLYYPCPRNGPNFRPKVLQMGGKKQFPYMVDPNTGVSMYESDNIIKYLVGKYGDGSIPFMLSLGLLTTLTEGFAMIGRLGKGQSYTPAKLPPKPLEVWAYEGSPFCKVVREVLVELELPHLQRSCARGSPKRQILIEKAKHFQVPYLEDPNTGVQMFESADIVEYLRATYAQ